MSSAVETGTGLVLLDRSRRLGVRLDPGSGLPVGLLHDDEVVPIALTARLETDGQERYWRSAPVEGQDAGHLDVYRPYDYVNTIRLDDVRVGDAEPTYVDNGPEETYLVTTEVGGWTLRWAYTFRQRHPRLELSVLVSPPPDAERATLRNLHLDFAFRPADIDGWLVEAPGNGLRPGVAAAALIEPVGLSPAGGVRGSSGLIGLHQPAEQRVIVLWPLSRTEIGEPLLHSESGALRLALDTGLAGRFGPGEALDWGTVRLDVLDGSWAEVRDQVPGWYETIGLATPRDRAAWIDGVSIFEVQIGYSVFRGGWEYGPYRTVRDLIADLGRIKGLGFDCLQIMPRQPYPSYNVHDYSDITTSYGDEDDLRELVTASHALGMRVILDILMHGVIDQEVMARTAARVRSDPIFARLDEPMARPFGTGVEGAEAMGIAWRRHILDFEAHWSGGSPARHRLVDEHPEWFMRNSMGEIIGVYTNAFDVANLAWQDSFMEAAEALVRRLDVDGFRFDAPTYNALPNWSPATARRASYSPLGCLELFARQRPRLKGLKPEAMLYTEPSGVLFHEVMDLTYNYDEQWLVGAVLRPSDDEGSRSVSVRHGRDLAAWFRERNAVLPPGAQIAHHIDSHDTFWWPLPGQKWRREQFGLEAARALLAVFALSGGAYMTFVGGEVGLEEDLRRVHRLRKELPEVGHGGADYEAVAVDRDEIYAVVRRLGSDASVLLVNLSDGPLEAAVALDGARLGLDAESFTLYDAWNDCVIDSGRGYAVSVAGLSDLRLAFAAYQPRLLVVRPVADAEG